MAVKNNGQLIYCDGAECSSRVNLPIALRPVLSGKSNLDELKGWLFVSVGGKRCHYCPNCVPRYLADLTSAESETTAD